MDPFKLLKADHEKVAGLFDRLESSSGKAKLDIFKQIKSELELHTHIEEKIFYPALERPEETHDLTLEAYEEHSVVKTLLVELSGARTANDEWQAKAKVLRESVEHHVQEEENELFDKADDALESEQLEALGDQMAAEKARQQGRAVSASGKAKATQSNKKKTKTGIITKIADLVGLGRSSKSKEAASKTSKKTRGTKTSRPASKTSGKGKAVSKASKRAVSSKASGKKKATKSSNKSSGRSTTSSRSKGAKGRSSTKKRA